MVISHPDYILCPRSEEVWPLMLGTKVVKHYSNDCLKVYLGEIVGSWGKQIWTWQILFLIFQMTENSLVCMVWIGMASFTSEILETVKVLLQCQSFDTCDNLFNWNCQNPVPFIGQNGVLKLMIKGL